MTRLSSVVLAALIVFVFAGTVLAQPPKIFAPARGDVEIGVLPTVTKVEKDMVVTTIKVKNLMTNSSIAGLKVEEYWWDKNSNPIPGSKDRLRKPLQPGEIATLTLRTPHDPKMFKNQYVFSQANGKVKPKQMKTF
jgi:hypothetical protein